MKTIYSFLNLINNKRYIGSTINEPEVRYKQHLYHVYHEDSENKYLYPLYCAIRKYREENFKFEILEQLECSEEKLRIKESKYIEQFNTLTPNGYKKVAKIDINTNKIIKIYDTIALAARENNCDNSGISKVCRKERNKCGGFKGEYV